GARNYVSYVKMKHMAIHADSIKRSQGCREKFKRQGIPYLSASNTHFTWRKKLECKVNYTISKTHRDAFSGDT
ncbi:hypothetical protein BGX38DRAFT_1188717, partial [Terfezia claveryi]